MNQQTPASPKRPQPHANGNPPQLPQKAAPVYKAALDGLHPDSTDEAVEAVIRMILDAGVKPVERTRVQEQVKKRLGGIVSIGSVREMFSQVHRQRNRERDNRTEDGKLIFRYQSDFNFDDGYNICIRVLKDENQKQGLPIYCCIDSQPVRLITTKQEGRTSVRFDTIKGQPMWSELNELVTFVNAPDDEEGYRSARTGYCCRL